MFRYRVPGGFSDAPGELIAVDPDGVTVATRRGEIRVPADLIAIAKLISPPMP